MNFYLDLNENEIERYARHISLSEIGLLGQKKLKASSILCIGSGGLGSPLLIYLAAAGVGQIGIVDCDIVENSNLQRQIIHSTKWINKPKTESAKSRIIEINPNCKIDTYETKLSTVNALEIIKKYDVICDCTDNFPTRYLINDACVILNKPNIYGSIDKFEGQVTVFNLNDKSPNYRDMVPKPPPQELIPSCSEAGVIGVLPGIIGLIQATEAIKIVTGIGETLNGRLLVIDALNMKFKELKLTQCQFREEISELVNYEDFCEVSDIQSKYSIRIIKANELFELIRDKNEDIFLIDVRDSYEYKDSFIPGANSLPLKDLEKPKTIDFLKEKTKHKKLYVYCKSGARSLKALLYLKRYGINGQHLDGGINAWKNLLKNNQ